MPCFRIHGLPFTAETASLVAQIRVTTSREEALHIALGAVILGIVNEIQITESDTPQSSEVAIARVERGWIPYCVKLVTRGKMRPEHVYWKTLLREAETQTLNDLIYLFIEWARSKEGACFTPADPRDANSQGIRRAFVKTTLAERLLMDFVGTTWRPEEGGHWLFCPDDSSSYCFRGCRLGYDPAPRSI